MPSRRFRALLFLQLALGVLGLFTELPSWRMFYRVERLQVELTDARGRVVPLADFLPRFNPILSLQPLLAATRFVCLRHPEARPFLLMEKVRGKSFVFAGERCAITAR